MYVQWFNIINSFIYRLWENEDIEIRFKKKQQLCHQDTNSVKFYNISFRKPKKGKCTIQETLTTRSRPISRSHGSCLIPVGRVGMGGGEWGEKKKPSLREWMRIIKKFCQRERGKNVAACETLKPQSSPKDNMQLTNLTY